MLVVLYAVGLIAANPIFAIAFFYVALLAWASFTVYAGKTIGAKDRWIAQAMWVCIAVWCSAIVAAFMFAAFLGAILWFAGTMGTSGFGSFLLARAFGTRGGRQKVRYRRYGLAAGVTASLAFLGPILVNAVVGGLGQLGGSTLSVDVLFEVVFIPDAVAIAFFCLALPPTKAV
jgi:hypothetical protein